MFIGIDPSYSGTGITLLNDLSNYTTTLIKGKEGANIDAIPAIVNWLWRLIEPHKDDVKLVCIEGGSFNSGGQLFTLGQLSGAIAWMCQSNKLKIIEVPPLTLKLFISGKGQASKEFVMRRIHEKYSVKFTDDNKADSFGLGVLAYRYWNAGDQSFREEAEVIAKLTDRGKKKRPSNRKYRTTKTNI